MIDHVDLEILRILQRDARTPNAQIARQLRMAPSAMLERVRKLKKRGIIEEFTVRVNAKAVDLGLLAYVFIKTNEKNERWNAGEIVARIPEVMEIHDIAGEDCYIVKLRTRDTDSLYRLLRDKFATIPSIAATRTTIVLRTEKESMSLPLAGETPRSSGTKATRRRPAKRQAES